MAIKKKHDYIAAFLLLLSLIMFYINIPFVDQTNIAKLIIFAVSIYLFLR